MVRRMMASLALFAWAATGSAQQIDWRAGQPRDPAIHHGTLENGLRWFVQRHAPEEGRVDLVLHVDVGALHEEAGEAGMAHFVEHMVFNGTDQHPAGKVVEYLESIGAPLGADSNAFTSIDQTVYLLHLDAEEEGVLESGLRILSEFAGRATLTDADIEQERGVVASEILARGGPLEEAGHRYLDLFLAGSRYAGRRIAGKESDVRSFAPEALRAFYRRWYRPDRMRVVVVGALDPTRVESMIRDCFDGLPAVREPAPVVGTEVAIPAEPAVETFSHAQVVDTAVALSIRVPACTPTLTGEDFLRSVRRYALVMLLNERLRQRAREANAPFLGAQASVQEGPRTPINAFQLAAGCEQGRVEPALRALIDEITRVRVHGIGADELARVKADLTAWAEHLEQERLKTPAREIAQWIVTCDLMGDYPAEPGYAHAASLRAVDQLDAEQLDLAAKEWLPDTGWMVWAQGPESAEKTVPSAEDLRRVVEQARGTKVVSRAEAGELRPLMARPKPGRVVREGPGAAPGSLQWVLSNGATVLLKPTEFRADSIEFAGSAPGGSADVPDSDLAAVRFAASVVSASGAGELDAGALERSLAGQLLSATPYIDAHAHGIAGSARGADLERALQLVHLRFQQPSFRPAPIERLVRAAIDQLRHGRNDPEYGFGIACKDAVWGGRPHDRTLSETEVSGLTAEALERVYRGFFCDASTFTFVLVGAFDPRQVRPLVEAYLATLPSRAPAPTVISHADPGYPFPTAIRTLPVVTAEQEKCRWVLAFPVQRTPLAQAEEVRLILAEMVLETRLNKRLRESMGATYSVAVGRKARGRIGESQRMLIAATGKPGDRERMVSAALEEIRALADRPPTAAEVEAVRKTLLADLAEGDRSNSAWLNRMAVAALPGLPPRSFDLAGLVRTIGPEQVRCAIRDHLPLDRYVCAYMAQEAVAAGSGK